MPTHVGIVHIEQICTLTFISLSYLLHSKVNEYNALLYIHRKKISKTLRFCKTAITWLRSLSAILPLFWRHEIAELHRLCREDLKMYYDVMKKATFSRGILLTLYKIRSFHSILPRNLTFSLLTWLGSSIFLIYLLVRTTNFLWVVFNKIWMIRFFAVVNYMVRKFSFCSNLYAEVIAKIILLHIFNNLKIVFISRNMILKLKSIIHIGTFIIHMKRLTTRVTVNFVDETGYCTSINDLDTPL